MKRLTTKGKCSFCGETFSKAAMTRHLDKCPQRQTLGARDSQNERLFNIFVQGRYSPEYWMQLEVRADAKLKNLDNFLRDTWLECCGHLSRFTIDGINYESSMEDAAYGDKSMNAKIISVLMPRVSFIHEYDYGSTTTLALKVISERKGDAVDNVEVLARNDPPTIACDVCGKDATQVCAQCIDEGEGWLCDKCAKKHKCGEEMLLPLVNSPRVGTCGYTG